MFSRVFKDEVGIPSVVLKVQGVDLRAKKYPEKCIEGPCGGPSRKEISGRDRDEEGQARKEIPDQVRDEGERASQEGDPGSSLG